MVSPVMTAVADSHEANVINVILLPVAKSLRDEARHDYMRRIFPRVFWLSMSFSASRPPGLGSIWEYPLSHSRDKKKPRWCSSQICGWAVPKGIPSNPRR